MKYLKVRSINENKQILTVSGIVFLSNVIACCFYLLASTFMIIFLYEEIFSLFDSVIIKYIIPLVMILFTTIFVIFLISIYYPIYIVDKIGIHKIGLFTDKYFLWSEISNLIISGPFNILIFQDKKLDLSWNHVLYSPNSGYSIAEQIIEASGNKIVFPKIKKWIKILLLPVEYKCELENDIIKIHTIETYGIKINTDK